MCSSQAPLTSLSEICSAWGAVVFLRPHGKLKRWRYPPDIAISSIFEPIACLEMSALLPAFSPELMLSVRAWFLIEPASSIFSVDFVNVAIHCWPLRYDRSTVTIVLQKKIYDLIDGVHVCKRVTACEFGSRPTAAQNLTASLPFHPSSSIMLREGSFQVCQGHHFTPLASRTTVRLESSYYTYLFIIVPRISTQIPGCVRFVEMHP